MASLFIGKDASTLRLQGGAFYEAFDRAFDGAFERPSMGPSIGPSTWPSTGPSRRRPRVFEEKVGGFDRAFYGAFYRAFKEKAQGLQGEG
ncbi:hypothetical protein Tco_0430094 [Tanacetum coccineum]